MCEETPTLQNNDSTKEVDIKCPCGCEYVMASTTKTWWRCFDCNRYIEYDPVTRSLVLKDEGDDKIKGKCGKCRDPIATCEESYLDIEKFGMMHISCAKEAGLLQ